MSASGVPAFAISQIPKDSMSKTAAVLDSSQASEAQAWWFLDTLVVEHLMASGAGPVVLEMTLPAGAAPPLHLHHDLDDSSFLLDGQMVVRCGDQMLLAGAGNWLSCRAGYRTPSGWWVISLPASCWCTTTTASCSSTRPRPGRGHRSCPLPQAVPAWRSCPGRWPSMT